MKHLFVTAAVCVLAGGFLAGCGPSGEELYKMFQDEDPAVRLRAARQAGESKDLKAAPYLVDRLTDSEPEVRFVAILALEKITGTRRGYDYFAPAERRKEAVRQWRDWLEHRSEEKATTRPTGGSSP